MSYILTLKSTEMMATDKLGVENLNVLGINWKESVDEIEN